MKTMSSVLHESAARFARKPATRAFFGRLAGARSCRRIVAAFAALAASLAALAASQWAPAYFPAGAAPWLWLPVAVCVAATARYLHLDLIEPSRHLHAWLQRVHAGDLAARLPPLGGSSFAGLCDDLNTFCNMLEAQSRDTESQLQRHAGHLTEKTRSLALLYRFAASLAVSHNLDELLEKVLAGLQDIYGIDAVVIRLRLADGGMQLLASSGLPAHSPQLAKRLDGGSEWLQTSEAERRVAVPMQYHGETLGACILHLDAETFANRAHLRDLFASLSRHLGMAIEKMRLDRERERLSIVEERTHLAHELHDSLAQTIAGLRFQMGALAQTLDGGAEPVRRVLAQMENSIDEANLEVRELVRHFRAPVEKGSLLQSVRKVVERFRHDNPGVKVFFQEEWPGVVLPDQHELNILRIVQEALMNVRKHSRADFVRILMRGRNGHYRVLIEDNGVGAAARVSAERAGGEHVGLDVMRERARRIGGELDVNSEPGEGMRVAATFDYPGGAGNA